MDKNTRQGRQKSQFQKRILSFGYAFKGIFYAIKTQANFKIHLAIAALVIITGIYFGVSKTEWTLLFIAIGIVLAAELFNTAIETLTDLISPAYDHKAGITKDLAAGAVLITAITAVIIGLIIFIPKIF